MLRFLSFLLFLNSAQARSYGVSDVVCQNMTPVHGQIEPQLSIARVQVLPHAFKVRRGQRLKVTLQVVSNDFTFRGFLIQARDLQTGETVGNFVTSGKIKVMVCGKSFSTATHANPTSKSSELLLWNAPSDFRGFVRF